MNIRKPAYIHNSFVDQIMAIMRIRFIGASPYAMLFDPDGVVKPCKGDTP